MKNKKRLSYNLFTLFVSLTLFLYKDVKQKNRPSWYFNYLRQYSYFLKFLSPRINALLRMMGVKSFGTSERLNDFLSKENIAGWRECQKMLLEIKKETQQRDIKLVIVLLVDASRLDKNFPFRQTHKVVKDFLQNNGIPVVDLLDRLDGKDLSGYRVSLLDAHPNPELHRLYAEEIFKSLIENNLLN